MSVDNAPTTGGFLADVGERVHAARCDEGALGGSRRPASLDVLWWRKSIDGSPLADHIRAVRNDLYGDESGRTAARKHAVGWTYDPELELTRLKAPAAQDGPFAAWTRGCVEMTENARRLLEDIHRIREGASGERPPDVGGLAGDRRRVWRQPVIVGEDPIGVIIKRARDGANDGRSTKSACPPCTAPSWAAVMEEYGLQGVAAYPTITAGSWYMALLLHDVHDWREDYISILDYSFYFEYNVDTATFGRSDPARLIEEIIRTWDMPDLPAELQLRRSHMACSMVYFDTKRKYEAKVKTNPTTGLNAWVHCDRDQLRDFMAIDFGGAAHYLSYLDGVTGRDDMMLSRLVNDWVDLGPDLRNEECNQGVLGLTQGSLVMPDLLDCYKRTVWMLNAEFHSTERYVGCMVTLCTCLWQTCNHRQDVWRYYALAFELCSAAESLDLYKECELADCYTPDFKPTEPAEAKTFSVPREQLPYHVQIDGKEHSGEIALHRTLCDAVHSGLFPMSVVEFEFIVPHLLRRREISASTFLAHMDSIYCDNYAALMRSGYTANFSQAYGWAMGALAMEQWWTGMNFAIAAGSLIETQPGHVAGDRAH